MLDKDRPTWQLPAGLTRGAWDYVHEESIAVDYDRFHDGHPLLELDRRIIANHTCEKRIRSENNDDPAGKGSAANENSTPNDTDRRVAIDFGCGTGRNLVPFVQQGWSTIGVDLSIAMLKECQVKLKQQWEATGARDGPAFLQANMARLDCFAGEFADVALCMYSSLGMVQGRPNRRTFMSSVHRLLKPDGMFIVHVHNRG
ncbi:MAG: class I SAM-dependent methyltransferase, partial [Pirellula sp.]